MMSADKFVRTRVKAAAETWASSIKTWNKQASVDVEVFAQSNYSVGHPIIRMQGVQGKRIGIISGARF
jgi:chondroitin sulfate synthase